MPSDDAARKKTGIWFLWWIVDPDELDRQVADYATRKFWRSARGISALLLGLSVVITVIFAVLSLGGFDLSALIDAGIMAVLALFIAFGHRWAMIGAMIVWTIEKALMIVFGIQSQSYAQPIFQVIWWCFYMRYFFLAFRIEQRRRQLMKQGPNPADAFT